MVRMISTSGCPVLRCRWISSPAKTGPRPATVDINFSAETPWSAVPSDSMTSSRFIFVPELGYAYVSFSPKLCCGVIGRNEDSMRRSASRRMMFGALGNISKTSDIISSSLLGTAVLKANSTIRSESGLLKPVNSAEVRCFRRTIRKSSFEVSSGGRASEVYKAGFCGSAMILNAGSLRDLVWKMNPLRWCCTTRRMMTSLSAARRFSAIAINAKFSILIIVGESNLLDVGTRYFIGPGEVFRVDQHPDKAEQERKYRNQISKGPQTRALRIERHILRAHDNEPPVFHAGRLAGTQHE